MFLLIFKIQMDGLKIGDLIDQGAVYRKRITG
jgi:hypothetical protein